MPTNPDEYILPSVDLPEHWKYSINEKGQIYYYHDKILIPHWASPIKLEPLGNDQAPTDIAIKLERMETDEFEKKSDDDDDDEDDIISSSNIDAKRLLTLKSDPDLERYNDEDSSSTDSDDSSHEDLELKLINLQEQLNSYFGNYIATTIIYLLLIKSNEI